MGLPSHLSPELLRAFPGAFACNAPLALKRAASARFGLPLRREVRAAGIVFIHVPKNAGTTISTQLYGGHIGHRSARFYRACDPEFFASHPSFAITRDPLARFCSAFAFAGAGGSQEVPASPAAHRFAGRFASATDCARAIAAMGPKARDRLDPVFRSQSHYVCNEDGRVLVGELLRLEDLGPGFTIAGRTLSLNERRNPGGAADGTDAPGLAEAVARAYPEDNVLLEGGR